MFGVTLLVITPNAVRGWLPSGADRDPGQVWSREQELRVAERRIHRSVPTRLVFVNYWTGGRLTRDHRFVPERLHENQSVIKMIRSLDIDAQVNLLGVPNNHIAFLADNYNQVRPRVLTPDTPFMKYLE